jgi:nuclear pore complex protein Nup98-Nup96
MHNVSEACNVLAERKDFRLATLVAQIGGDRTTHEVMATQIEAWRNLNVLSEMTDSIRTLYGLLAGNTCVCEGKKGQLEDRARTFVISERWHLGWKNVFGLKLWYGTLTEEPLQVTVRKFAADLEEKEVTKPLPWFIESAADTMWKDNSPEQRIDPLWGILKLFTDAVDNTQTIRLSDMVMPQNTVGNPIHTRLSFDLYHGLQTRLPLQADPSAADQLAWNFAAELESAGSWTWAVFAVMHLSKPDHRQLAIQELLARNASRVDEHDSETLQLLFDEFKIPEGWLWQAKALFARSVLQNHVKELEYLLRAKHWQEAHKTLCEVVAPQAIVEQNYTTLQQLLNNFTGKDQVHGWDLGGQIYEDYVGLAMGLPGTGRSTVVRRLLRTLPAMVHERPGKLGFVQRVAVEEMSSMVGKAVLGDEENVSILQSAVSSANTGAVIRPMARSTAALGRK